MTKRGRYTGERGGVHSYVGAGSGYWLELKCKRHMRMHTGTGVEKCVLCGRVIEAGRHYVYVIPTKDCVCLSRCFVQYPKSLWIETGTKVEAAVVVRQTKQQKEEEYLLSVAVSEVLDEGRSVDEVAEEFDLDVSLLTKEVEHADNR